MQKENFATETKTTDQLTAIRQNDEGALKALYLENYPKVEQYVLTNSGTVEEAKDIFQEAFIAVWRNVQANRFTESQGGSLAGYLFQVAKYKWLDHLRSAHVKKHVSLPKDNNGWLPAEELPEEEQAYLAQIRNNFAKLGQNCRDLLKRFYFQKQSMRTIAAAFDWTEATAKNNKYRCLQRLRELIK